jgi:hypothetical protein
MIIQPELNVMLEIANVSLHSFVVALRWARIKGYPDNIQEWTKAHNEKIQAVCEECDRRRDWRREIN